MQGLTMKRIVIGALLALGGCAESGTSWWQKDWPLRQAVTVDTTASGVNVSGEIGRTPVLVRLHSGNFDFGSSADNGADLRVLAADNKTPLIFHIESFDPLLGVAALWVDMPKLAGGEKQALWLYHGNKNAPATVDTARTFDANTVLALHYDQAAATPVADKTAFKNNPTTQPSSSDESSIIGRGARFAASPGMTVPASPSLAIPAGGGFTFATWVKPDANPAAQAVFARDGVTVGFMGGAAFVTAGATRIAAATPAAAGQWVHVAVTADGRNTRLYVNGQEAGLAPGALPAMTGPLTIGGAANAPYSGGLDETRLSKVARPPAAILVDAQGQGAEGKLTAFGPDEEQGGGGGTIMYILKATPLLDWAIIALCMVLLAGAIAVMIVKNAYLSRAKRANAAFMRRFNAMDELVRVDQIADMSPGERQLIDAAPVAHLYERGIEELQTRQARRGNRPLTSEAVNAIRSSVNSVEVTENQKLDSAMVLLTIAISGGPFIGLLGTVMGVMNTFGGVAMAGDVNVNAIAPGIAAALLATIAGLAAAIPSLFGYNYLNSQITAMADQMRVFTDQLVTRLAETQADRAAPLPPVAPHLDKLAAE